MLSTLVATVCLVGHPQPGLPKQVDPIGSYRFDVSQSPAKSRGILNAFFGPMILRIKPDGYASLQGLQMDAFWRWHQGRIVVVYRSLFMRQRLIPDEVLGKSWPESHLEGLVFEIAKDGSLRLKEFGAVRGPVVLRKIKNKMTTRQLILKSDGDNYTSSEVADAWSIIHEERGIRFKEILAVILNPNEDIGLRGWAAILLSSPPSEEVALAMLEAVPKIKAKGERADRQAASIRNTLARGAASFYSKKVSALLCDYAQRGLAPRMEAARSVQLTEYDGAKAMLLDCLSSNSEWEREAACTALAKLDEKDSIGKIRPLSEDKSERVRLAALGALAKWEPDSQERQKLLKQIFTFVGQEMLIENAAVRALSLSNCREAVPFLAATLLGKGGEYAQRDAASALGRLGYKEAVPALLEAKQAAMSNFQGLMVSENVGKAVVEALWLLQHSPKRG